jgi:hypothetical protein
LKIDSFCDKIKKNSLKTEGIMKKKMSLKALKVQSFVTSLEKDESKKVKAGNNPTVELYCSLFEPCPETWFLCPVTIKTCASGEFPC